MTEQASIRTAYNTMVNKPVNLGQLCALYSEEMSRLNLKEKALHYMLDIPAFVLKNIFSAGSNSPRSSSDASEVYIAQGKMPWPKNILVTKALILPLVEKYHGDEMDQPFDLSSCEGRKIAVLINAWNKAYNHAPSISIQTYVNSNDWSLFKDPWYKERAKEMKLPRK